MLGMLYNTYNDAELLARSLYLLSAAYRGPYTLYIDDDGSSFQELSRIRELADQYGGRVTSSPHRKFQLGPYVLVREMELFEELAQFSSRILKIDPDTVVLDGAAFSGPPNADLYGTKKTILTEESNWARVVASLSSFGLAVPCVASYCQGGFYVLSPSLVRKITCSEAWHVYQQNWQYFDFETGEDRLLGCLAQGVNAEIAFWDHGYHHGVKTEFEYQCVRFQTNWPFARPLTARLNHISVMARKRRRSTH